jgi:transposase InsO family protein
MAESGDVLRMLAPEDKLDGSNYPMWAYMMRHVLVAKGLWNIVQGLEKRPANVATNVESSSDVDGVEDVEGSNAFQIPISRHAQELPPIPEQVRWDAKDAQAHALIALSVKRAIIPHIRSCRTAKDAWDTLTTLYQARNEARVAYLRKQLESEHMNEGDSMDSFLTKIKDLKEQLISADEVIPDSSLVQTVLNGLPDSYQSFASTLRLMMKGNPNALSFEELVSVLLQEDQSRQNRSIMRVADQAFLTSQKGKGKWSSSTSKQKSVNAAQSKNQDKDEKKSEKQKLFCKYCKGNDHIIKNCPKLAAKEAKKKEAGMAVAKASTPKTESANLVQEEEWAFTTVCSFDPSSHDQCMSAVDSDVWYFDSGATKHITSQRSFFSSLEPAPTGNTVTCANNSSYPVMGVGKIILATADGSSFTLSDALFVPGIKKNLLSVSALAKIGLVVKFVDDRCTVHDLSNGDVIIASGILCHGLYKLIDYERSVNDLACAVHDSQAMSDAKLWHARFGHLNFASLLRLQKSEMVSSLPKLEAPRKHVCEGCILGKMQRSSFPKDGTVRATKKLQLVHSDVCGPMQTPSFGNYLYFVTFIDDFSRHAWVYPLKAKSEVFMCFKQFLVLAENLSACKMGTLRSDRGGEYMSSDFNAFLTERGIKHQCTVPYTPQQNGVAERKNRSLMEMARCMVKSQALPHSFWLEAVMCAAYVLNRCPTKALQSITPYEAWHDRKPSVAHLRVFGCLAYALVPEQHRKKLDDKAVKCIFVGYSSESKGYRLYHPQTKRILVSRDVVFVEDAIQPLLSCTKETSVSSKDMYDTLMPLFTGGQPSTGPNEATSQHLQVSYDDADHSISDADLHDAIADERADIEEAKTMPKWLVQTLRDSKLDAPLSYRTRSGSHSASFASDCYAMAASSLCDENEPVSFDEAQNSENWMAAMQSEYDAIMKNGTWSLCDLPPGKKAIGTKWVYKLKRKPDGTVDRYKARLVAKGYAQERGIDFDETFAPTCRMTTVRSICALAAHHGWNVHQLDIKTAFLNGDLHEEVYVFQPRGFVQKGHENQVCRLKKALYGLKQAPRAWYEKIHACLTANGFENSPTESTLYVKRANDVLLIIVVYVDDMLLTGPMETHIADFKADLHASFEMSDLGHLHHYLGIQFMHVDGGMALCQTKYIDTLLQRFGLEDCKPIATPMETGLRLSLHDAGDAFDAVLYQQAVGCLIYLCITRPDIQFAVSQMSRFMHCPGVTHWKAVKRIFRYLSGTRLLGLFYPKGGSLPPDLHAFSDSDWAGCYDTRVSTSGFCFMLGSSCISWLSKKQPTVATSSCEAEYRAAFTATVECVWLRRLMADLGVGQSSATTIFTDSQSALAVARNPVFHARTKHIEVHYHYVRERFSAGEISLAYVPTQENIADLFTKALPREKFEAFRKALGLLPFVD